MKIPLFAWGVLGCLLALWPKSQAPLLLYNASESLPKGFYLRQAAQSYQLGDLVLVRPPEALNSLMTQRSYLPRDLPMMKRIAALEGQCTCRQGDTITIDGRHVAKALPQDRAGRPLPRWQGCRTLSTGEVFLLNPEAFRSFDSRYFGSVTRESLVGRLRPLWLWEGEA